MNSYDVHVALWLPRNGGFRTLHDVVTFFNILFLCINYIIQYLSPPSKESKFFKALVHAETISVFLFCCIWSVLLKWVPLLDLNFFYCEGYHYIIGTSCATGFSLHCIAYGSFACVTISTYLFRLYLLVDHSHFLKISYVFPCFFVSLGIAYSIIPAFAFYAGHSEFDPKKLPINLTDEETVYYTSKSAAIYSLETFTQQFYPIYFVFLTIGGLLFVSLVVIETVRTIHRKQSMMSVGVTKHHLTVLKILTIQLMGNAVIACCAPVVVIMTIFIHINPYVINASLILFGTNSFVQSLMTMFLNPVFRKTVFSLVKHRSISSVTSIHVVDSSHKH